MSTHFAQQPGIFSEMSNDMLMVKVNAQLWTLSRVDKTVMIDLFDMDKVLQSTHNMVFYSFQKCNALGRLHTWIGQ